MHIMTSKSRQMKQVLSPWICNGPRIRLRNPSGRSAWGGICFAQIWIWSPRPGSGMPTTRFAIREIESTFRALKTDLELRPIYYKNDEATMAHLHLGLLAYWLVNTIRCKLKSKGVTYNWKEIVRIGNTQKIVTTHGWNAAGVEIQVKKYSKPQEKLKDLLAILNLKQRPYAKKSIEKSVVHKLPLEKRGSLENRGSP